MDLIKIIIILGVVLLLIGAYILVTILNKKTKIPEGCELAYLEARCNTCLSKTCEIKKEEVTE